MRGRVLLGIIGAVILFSAGYAANALLDSGDEDDATAAPTTQPTIGVTPRSLTGGEAEAKSELFIQKEISLSEGIGAFDYFTSCNAEDLNESTGDWIVECTVDAPDGLIIHHRHRVHDATGEVTLINIRFE